MAMGELGNTDSNSLSKCVLSKRTEGKHYCFTFNNYKDFGLNGDKVLQNLQKFSKKIIFQEEVGASGTPHLQGYVELLAKKRITALKKIIHNTVHWEICRDIDASIEYCQKGETRVGDVYSYGFPIDVKVINKLWDWQQTIVNMISIEPDDRSIIWVYDPAGNNGKTALLKYLVKNNKIIFTCGGKNADVINLIYNNKDYITSTKNAVVLWNLPRTVEPDYISYNAIESIKDGLICNNKFECGSFICNSPHLIVFSNCLPKYSALTADRWKVYTIEDKILVPWGN